MACIYSLKDGFDGLVWNLGNWWELGHIAGLHSLTGRALVQTLHFWSLHVLLQEQAGAESGVCVCVLRHFWQIWKDVWSLDAEIGILTHTLCSRRLEACISSHQGTWLVPEG